MREMTFLEGINETGTPPCDCLVPQTCGKPSTVRLHGKCASCGNNGYFFACGECSAKLLAGISGCDACGTTDYVTVRVS